MDMRLGKLLVGPFHAGGDPERAKRQGDGTETGEVEMESRRITAAGVWDVAVFAWGIAIALHASAKPRRLRSQTTNERHAPA